MKAEVVDGEPGDVGDLLVVRQRQGDLVVQVSVQNVGAAFLVGDDHTLGTGPRADEYKKYNELMGTNCSRAQSPEQVLSNAREDTWHLKFSGSTGT